jgi:predicted nuclease of predicted toxin-antitoxin system
MAWARQNEYVVFTHDLDFGALLAVTEAEGPSVIQIRTTDVTPDAQGQRLLVALEQFKEHLADGALISIDESRARVRLLPLK